jgi:replicative DNA helicase
MTTTALRLVSPEAPAYRQAPHNVEAEQALLGAILVNNEAYYRVADFLEPKHFFDPLHLKIFEIVQSLIRANKLASPITLKNFLEHSGDVAGLTPSQYLARMAAEATTVINAEDYGRNIYDLAVRRNLVLIGEDMVNIAYDAPVDMPPKSQIEDAERRLYDLAEKGAYAQGFQRFTDSVTTAIQQADAAFRRDGNLSGASTGIKDLDKITGGLQPSDLIVLAGRPGMGKTALATNIAFNIAKAYESQVQADGAMKTTNGGIVGFFSLEMSCEQLATRIISEQAEIASYKIRRGEITEHDFGKLTQAAGDISRIPLYIDDTGGISITQLASRARRLKRQHGLDLLVVDYLQLLSGSSKKGDNRVQELTEITTGMKALAKELEVPIIALSQLSRQVENRDDKRPQLSDLRESGSIEQDADVVIFVYREEYYVKNRKPKEGTEDFTKWLADMENVSGKAEVIIGKQRHGPTGTVELAFEAEFTRFYDLAPQDQLPEKYM